MKKLLTLAVCVGTTVVALGQDGTVRFATFAPPTIDARVLDVDGNPVKGADGYVAQLAWAETEGGALTPFGSVESFLDTPEAANGYIVAGTQGVPGKPGADVFIAMQAWNSNDGASYADALAAGGPTGMSNVIPITLGDPTADPPGVPADLVGLQGFQLQGGEVIPEPSTFALGLIGIGALMLRRRK